MKPRLMLGIETSCDETAAAVVTDRFEVRSSVIASQIEIHAEFGGVVPEIASRGHLEQIETVVGDALTQGEITPADLTAISVTRGPGLIGALLVGVSAAKALGLAWDLPVVGVNHLSGHLMSALLDNSDQDIFPAVMLLVSGGHCHLVRIDQPGKFTMLGGTVDDSAGEAYDKIARFLGLGYPGGPIIDRLAATVEEPPTKLPRPMLDDGLDFSFSGLKTATVRYAQSHPEVPTEGVCSAFVDASMDVLVTKSMRALQDQDLSNLIVVGGVAASPVLRKRLTEACESRGYKLSIPHLGYATDNAAMIAAAGWYEYDTIGASPLDFGADPSLAFGYS